MHDFWIHFDRKLFNVISKTERGARSCCSVANGVVQLCYASLVMENWEKTCGGRKRIYEICVTYNEEGNRCSPGGNGITNS